MQPKTVIVTGGNGGLGYACALEILRADPAWHVLIAARDRARCEQAVRTLAETSGNPNVRWLPLDLGSLASVRAFAEEVGRLDGPPLGAIACNAGVQFASGTHTTSDGYEATFGINHLGHFLLVNLLLPHLASGSRVVFVSSGTHDPAQRTGMPAPRYTDARTLARPSSTDATPGPVRYTTSKLCNLYCAYELDRRLRAGGREIAVAAFDPGMMPGTGLARSYPPLLQWLWRRVLPILVPLMRNVNTVERSGAALAWLLTAPEAAGIGGKYFEGRREIRSSPESYDTSRATELWAVSAELVGIATEQAC